MRPCWEAWRWQLEEDVRHALLPPGSGGGAGVLGVAEDAEVDVDVVRGHGHGVPVRIRVRHRSGGMGSGASATAAAASMGGRGSGSFSLQWAAADELSGGEARRIERHVTLTPLFFHLSTFCRWGAGVVTGHRRCAGTQGNDGVKEGGVVGAAREVLATTGAVGDEESIGSAGEGDGRRGKGGVERRRERGRRRRAAREELRGRREARRRPPPGRASRRAAERWAAAGCRREEGAVPRFLPLPLRPPPLHLPRSAPPAAHRRPALLRPPRSAGPLWPPPFRPRTCSAPAVSSIARSSRRRPGPPVQ
jgi:hypothetical protein